MTLAADSGMTSRGDWSTEADSAHAALSWRLTADGSPSLWSATFGQAFHCRSGALAESSTKFIRPAQLERFRPGDRLQVVEVCVGLGYNTASLLEAANDRGLSLEWWGLELDPQPLALALAEPRFRRLWRPTTLTALDQLHAQGQWLQSTQQPSKGRWWLGDARCQLRQLPAELNGGCDLVFLDAFSPGRCPQLWTQEFLGQLAELLRPEGRLLTYCTAAAVRRGLELAGLQLASLRPEHQRREGEAAGATEWRSPWSGGTAASPTAIPADDQLRPLSEMEREHLMSRASVPYRDPLGWAEAGEIKAQRRAQQQLQPGTLSTSAWRRRWGVER